MSGVTFETTPTPPGFVPTEAEAREARAESKAVRDLELERKLRLLVVTGSGWAVCLVLTAILAASLYHTVTQPRPQDTFTIGWLHDDGTYDAPVIRSELRPSQRTNLLIHTARFYIQARENYVWEAIQANYDAVSAVSTPAVRDAYQTIMLDRRNAQNPAVLYGTGVGAARAQATDIDVHVDPKTPNAFVAYFNLRVAKPGEAKPPTVTRMMATMTWIPAADHIPIKIQQQYDPAGIAFSGYEAFPAPGGNP